MAGEQGGELIDVLKSGEKAVEGKGGQTSAVPEPQMEEGVDRSVVYLTSESPYTLDRLEPHTSYVIGGIVDRNREKGLCYKRAVEKKVRTAKLPIGEYMAMQSRFVLTTNQVVEIMAKWLECGDWGQAFLNVIPQRKGGVLKHDSAANQHCGEEVEDGLEGEVAEENGEAETERAAVEETVHDNGLEQATTNGSGLAAAAEATQR
jgi:tRNA (guanine9-N1)-methyltransferase